MSTCFRTGIWYVTVIIVFFVPCKNWLISGISDSSSFYSPGPGGVSSLLNPAPPEVIPKWIPISYWHPNFRTGTVAGIISSCGDPVCSNFSSFYWPHLLTDSHVHADRCDNAWMDLVCCTFKNEWNLSTAWTTERSTLWVETSFLLVACLAMGQSLLCPWESIAAPPTGLVSVSRRLVEITTVTKYQAFFSFKNAKLHLAICLIPGPLPVALGREVPQL